jgi:hypothetical protein
MVRKGLALAVAAVTVAAIAGTALAASAVKDPMRLILTRADVAGAKQTVQQAPIDTGGVRGKFAGYSYYFMRGQLEGLQVAGGVYAVESAAQAQKVFASLQRQPGGTSPGTKVQLPRYGDQQIAWHKASASYAKALVRKNTVVWQVEIVGTGSFAPVDELAELKKYALKQQRRVGSG